MTLAQAAAHKMWTDAAMGVSSARRELMRAMPYAEALAASSEDVVWDVTLAFDEEENRYQSMVRENEELREEINRLRTVGRDSTPPRSPTTD